MRIVLLISLLLAVPAYAGLDIPAPEGKGTYAELSDNNTFEKTTTFNSNIIVQGTATVGGSTDSRINFNPNSEYIDNTVDDYLLFQGVGGTDGNQNITFDLDGTNYPTIFSDAARINLYDAFFVRGSATEKYMLEINNTDAKSTSSLSTSGINMTHYISPTSTKTADSYGVNGLNYINTANLGNTNVYGLYFTNVLLASATQADFYGLNTLGISDDGGQAHTVDNVYGAYFKSATQWYNTLTIGGNAYGAYIAKATGCTITGTQYGLFVENPDIGTAGHEQVYLEGSGANGCSMNVEAAGAACTGGEVLDVGATYQLCVVCD